MDLDAFDERVEMATQAMTTADLKALVDDLPSVEIEASEIPAPVPAVRSEELPSVPQRRVLAVFGGASRAGQWEVPQRMKATAVFGGVELDLRNAVLAPGVTEIRCLAVFGGVELQVPAGVRVECEGTAVFGGFEREGGHGPYADDAPTVRITGTAVFGGVSVEVSKRRKRSGKRVDVDSDSDLKKLPRKRSKRRVKVDSD